MHDHAPQTVRKCARCGGKDKRECDDRNGGGEREGESPESEDDDAVLSDAEVAEEGGEVEVLGEEGVEEGDEEEHDCEFHDGAD